MSRLSGKIQKKIIKYLEEHSTITAIDAVKFFKEHRENSIYRTFDELENRGILDPHKSTNLFYKNPRWKQVDCWSLNKNNEEYKKHKEKRD